MTSLDIDATGRTWLAFLAYKILPVLASTEMAALAFTSRLSVTLVVLAAFATAGTVLAPMVIAAIRPIIAVKIFFMTNEILGFYDQAALKGG